MAIKTEMLRCFVMVAEHGNLADAAARLGRSPSAVSMMLAQLEAHLGGRLFETGQKAHLSALGVFVLDHARRELDHFDRTLRVIESFARAESGFVRVAAVPLVAAQILPGVVRSYLARRPGVFLDIRDSDSAGVLRALEAEEADIGIASGGAAGAWLARETLMSDAFGLVCRADHPLAGDEPLDWQALASAEYIDSGLSAAISDPVFQEIAGRATLRVHNTTSLLALVREGLGVTVLPRLVTATAPAGLVFRPLADTMARRQIELMSRAGAGLSPAAAAFADSLRAAATP
ncbi:LysR family transcriptional regulator [Maritimibacter sp. 55A14]|uniref:LysR family transcriptional regulator n=1 Tax=Maritimibacter sp. 55A14 TaxID=2174844 RepID=UPI000D62072F|nr:LysR family transcriptional regulator [Maritimibacter sp. 55A14]PWE33860.1 LysR family transcriptional regulator [Maritimibacter sp. 55A14]